MSPPLFSQVAANVVVDVDSMDPTVAASFIGAYQFTDMTSNQAIAYGESTRPERRHLVKEAVEKVKSGGIAPGQEEKAVDDAVDLLTVLLAKEVFPYLKGRVHAQTSPPTAYNTDATIAHARKLVSLFESNGIPKDRVCIKIPATGPSIVACQTLESQYGIRTLATCLFSVSQAVAAHQAGCLYVAPYFNELRVHFEPSTFRTYTDTTKEHPMAPVISDIIRALKRLDSKTLVMPASIVTATEVLALASLGPDHLTLSGAVLSQLTATSSSSDPELKEAKPQHPEVDVNSLPAQDDANKDQTTLPASTDYLANSGKLLRQALEADTEASRKLADALQLFSECERKTRKVLKKRLGLSA